MQILGTLTMRVAHDFNNSLTSVIGNAQLVQELLTRATTSSEQSTQVLLQRAIPMIQDAVRKALEIGDLVKVLQNYAREQPPTRETLDINQAVRDRLTMAQKLLGTRNKVEFIPARELPELYIDRAQLDQILFSLLGKSKESMPWGGRITIQTKMAVLDQQFAFNHPGAKPGTYVSLSVTDTGGGMDAQAVQGIFNLFSSTKRGEQLGGLGLPSVYAIVKQHRGYIDVESWPGKGTRFEVYLPITDQPVSTAQQLSTAQPSPQFAPQGPPISPNVEDIKIARYDQKVTPVILVIEDEVDIQRFLERSITNAGYKPVILSRGDQGLKMYSQLAGQGGRPALVIADLGLPGLDGRSLFKRIRQFDPKAALLLTSGYQIPLQADGRETEEGFDFIQKPFEQNTLLARIDAIVRHKDG
jgi:CheY-like chemotaxis protein